MPRKTKPSFIAELPLATTWRDERSLRIRLEKAKDLYNGVLCEALKRCDAMRADPRWKAAGKMPKATKEEKQARSKEFDSLAKEYGFTGGDLQKYAERMRDACSIGDHLRSHDTQTTAKRAFSAVKQFSFVGSAAGRASREGGPFIRSKASRPYPLSA